MRYFVTGVLPFPSGRACWRSKYSCIQCASSMHYATALMATLQQLWHVSRPTQKNIIRYECSILNVTMKGWDYTILWKKLFYLDRILLTWWFHWPWLRIGSIRVKLSHWGRVAHASVNQIIIVSENSPVAFRCQAIIWLNADLFHRQLDPFENIQ